jgi:hypothetical protein
MTTGIQCTADPGCRCPAPSDTGICHEHRQQARLAQMQRSPSAWVRATARILTRLRQPDHQAEPG